MNFTNFIINIKTFFIRVKCLFSSTSIPNLTGKTRSIKYFFTFYCSIIVCFLNIFFFLVIEDSFESYSSFSLNPKSCLKFSLWFSLSCLFMPSLHFLTPVQFLIIFSIISFFAHLSFLLSVSTFVI